MADIFTIQKRSSVMRAVKSKGNKSTELKLIELFKKNNIKGWRRNYNLFGKPDFVFPKKRIVVYADGCFWHGHGCRNTKPKDNENYWTKKILKNKKRDKIVVKELRKKGWIVFRIWECALKKGVLPLKLRQIFINK